MKVVAKWLKIENKEKINENIQVKEDPIGWLCHDAYDNEQ